ncbi:MAG: glycosyltransferase family 4 protein [Bacteroidota bacterium]|nr:glycosyltransferase family 4 protein [Bacteroidota bacterium]
MKSMTIAPLHEARINVLEVIGNSGRGGMENYIKSFIENLPADQFRVTCVCPYESQFTSALRDIGVEDVYITPVEDDPMWRSIQLVSEVARLHKIDVLHAHMPKAHALAGIAGCLVHKPIVATVHGMNVTSHELGITRAVNSHLITNCQEAYTQALAMGVDANKVDLIRNGVDVDLFTAGNSSLEFKRAINVPDGVPLIGFVGRLDNEKGPDMFVRMADFVHRERPDAHFVMVGDGNMRNQLKEMSAHMHLDDHLHFAGWWKTPVEVYRSLDVLAHTSRSDGTSMVLLEAMACGCATVGLAVGGVREIIESMHTGLIAGAGDWEGIAAKVLQLLEEPEPLRNMRIAARARVEQHFNLSANTGAAAQVLTRVAMDQNFQQSATHTAVSSGAIGRAAIETITN